MARLLVSVRSADEARAALAGGADVIDIKEPRRGPLGRADVAVWREVRALVPDEVPLSVALGDLGGWDDSTRSEDYAGVTFRKIGLAGAGRGWKGRWATVRESLGAGPAWVAVAYADWLQADAPSPADVLAGAREAGCAGVLVDTWDKSAPTPLRAAEPWTGWAEEVRRAGLFLALAGGLTPPDLVRLAPFRPNLFAVRGAACSHRDRLGAIDPHRVARLAQVARSVPHACGHDRLGLIRTSG